MDHPGVTVEKRVESLDVFRGITVAAMILVNNPGSFDDAYAQLRHAAWHGWTLTDWIFPFFLWIVGMSMVLSFERRASRGQSPGMMMVHVVRRTVILIALGLLINGFPFGLFGEGRFAWSTFRLPGVLQRIALCYAVVGTMLVSRASVRVRALSAVILAIGYWAAMTLIPVPGYARGTLEPEGNLCWFIDSSVLGSHTWVFAPAAGFDPEGILSTLLAIATTLLGTLGGNLLRSRWRDKEKVVWFLAAGLVLIAGGLLWDVWFPINKNLWSSSYVLFTGGCASVCFGVLFWIIDVQNWKRPFRPFRVYGSNAITVFVVSELLATLFWVLPGTSREGTALTLHDQIHEQVFLPLASPPVAALLFALAFVLVLFLVAWLMWRKGRFIKI